MAQTSVIKNPHIDAMSEDILYHLALGTKSHDLKHMFGDVKFVCVGGSPTRIKELAEFLVQQLDHDMPAGHELSNIANGSDRYAMYKVGPVLCVSHGMGMPSAAIMLHEVIKLIYHADAKQVTFIRLGTSGGLGLEPGTVVISDSTVDGMFNSSFDQPVLGRMTSRPARLDESLVKELLSCAKPEDHFKTVSGRTMCTLDFYEGQARADGAFCSFTETERMDFLKKCYKEYNIMNMEMESLCFAAMCTEAGVSGACVCVTLLNRLEGDQIEASKSVLQEYGTRPQVLVARLIRRRLGLD